MLHSYQSFWIQGSFLLAWNDVLFWTLLAVLVVVNALARVAARTAAASDRPRAAVARHAAIGGRHGRDVLHDLRALVAVEHRVAADVAVAVVGGRRCRRRRASGGSSRCCLAVPGDDRAVRRRDVARLVRERRPSFEAQTALIVGVATCLVLVSTSRVYKHLGSAGTVIAAVRYGGLNQADLAGLERGYYENLMGVDRFNGELWALYMNRPPDWERGLADAGLSRETGGFPPYELRPSTEGRFKGVPLRTNRWGLHDKEYAQTPPPAATAWRCSAPRTRWAAAFDARRRSRPSWKPA